MVRIFRMAFSSIFTFLLLSSVVTASAQSAPVWLPTGTLEAVIAGKDHIMRSFVTTVPEDAAERTSDPEARALLEKLAGTEQHTATWMITDPFEMGGIVLLPAMLFVSIGTRASEDSTANFALDIDTLELDTESDIEVRYFPESWSTKDFYALTEGTLQLNSVEVIDERTLRISGTVLGTLSFQESYSVEHNPNDTLPFEATFSIERVFGSQLPLELLGQ